MASTSSTSSPRSHNTPWGERDTYVLDCRKTPCSIPPGGSAAKKMHVSPFMPMEVDYDWVLSKPADQLIGVYGELAGQQPHLQCND